MLVDSDTGNNNSKLPVRWVAPEVLMSREFSTKSDVWSYGIVLWEMFSGGKQPYSELALENILDWINQGYRLDIPLRTPLPIKNLMLSCWEASPSKRPNFAEICVICKNVMQNVSEYVNIDKF